MQCSNSGRAAINSYQKQSWHETLSRAATLPSINLITKVNAFLFWPLNLGFVIVPVLLFHQRITEQKNVLVGENQGLPEKTAPTEWDVKSVTNFDSFEFDHKNEKHEKQQKSL